MYRRWAKGQSEGKISLSTPRGSALRELLLFGKHALTSHHVKSSWRVEL